MASWFWQKLDVFLAAVVIAVAGMAAAQGHEVLVQYIQRLGAEVVEAQDHLTDVRTGLRYRVMGDTVRAEAETEAVHDFSTLKREQDGIVGANPLIRPLAFARYHNAATLSETRRGFRPALPTTIGAWLYALVGMLAGFVVYEIVKLPVVFLIREPRRRKFRRRG